MLNANPNSHGLGFLFLAGMHLIHLVAGAAQKSAEVRVVSVRYIKPLIERNRVAARAKPARQFVRFFVRTSFERLVGRRLWYNGLATLFSTTR
jgi:hypothetical protein